MTPTDLIAQLAAAREALEEIAFLGTDIPAAAGNDDAFQRGFYRGQLLRAINVAMAALAATANEGGDDTCPKP